MNCYAVTKLCFIIGCINGKDGVYLLSLHHTQAQPKPPPLPPTNPVEKVEGEGQGRVTNQLQYLLKSVLRVLWRHHYAWPFQKPVDPVALKIPVSPTGVSTFNIVWYFLLNFRFYSYLDLYAVFTQSKLIMVTFEKNKQKKNPYP